MFFPDFLEFLIFNHPFIHYKIPESSRIYFESYKKCFLKTISDTYFQPKCCEFYEYSYMTNSRSNRIITKYSSNFLYFNSKDNIKNLMRKILNLECLKYKLLELFYEHQFCKGWHENLGEFNIYYELE